MKKLLALVLALVMTLSLCVTSNAAYKDAADVDYNEAVDVMTALGVLEGDQNGNFLPDAQLTRAAAAKIIAYLQLGNEVAEGLEGSGKVFSDVPASHWACGYIEYLNSVGVVAGIGNGKFDPNGALTNAAFAKMLLVVLGCDAEPDGLVGESWVVKTAKLANQSKIFDGAKVSINAVATRQEAALFAFNAITKGGLYTGASTGTQINVNGTKVSTNMIASVWGAGVAADKKNDFVNSYARANYDLRQDDAESDDLGRPSLRWYIEENGNTTYQSTKDTNVGVYTKSAAYTAVVAGSDNDTLAEILDDADLELKVTATTYTGDYAINGDAVTADAAVATMTAAVDAALVKGSVVELFTNDDGDVDNLVVYTWTLVKVDDVETLEKGDSDFDTYGISTVYTLKKWVDTTKTTLGYGYVAAMAKKDKANTQKLGDLAEGDLFLAVLDSNEKVCATEEISKVTGKVTAVGSTYLKIDGTKTTSLIGANVDDEGVFYTDPSGVIIAKDLSTVTTVDDALYVVDYWANTDTKYGTPSKTWMVQAVDTNGEVKELKVGFDKDGDGDMTDGGNKGVIPTTAIRNTVVKATYNSGDDVYTLTTWTLDKHQVNTIASGTALKTSTTKVGTTRLLSSTKYIVVEGTLGDIKVVTKEGGINFTLTANASAVAKKNGNSYDANVVFVPTTSYITTSADSVLYVDAAAKFETVKVDGDTCYSFDAYDMKGNTVAVVADDYPGASHVVAGFHTYTVDKNDVYTFGAAPTELNLEAGSTDYDDEEGCKSNLVYASKYNNLVSTFTAHYVDIDFENAKVVDLRDLDTAAYGKKVASLDAIDKAKDAGYRVYLDMYFDDGATVAFVTNIVPTTVALADTVTTAAAVKTKADGLYVPTCDDFNESVPGAGETGDSKNVLVFKYTKTTPGTTTIAISNAAGTSTLTATTGSETNDAVVHYVNLTALGPAASGDWAPTGASLLDSSPMGALKAGEYKVVVSDATGTLLTSYFTVGASTAVRVG